ncbi:MAG: hypothetical protein ABIQ47_17460 [Tepidiformaceae bacterium]
MTSRIFYHSLNLTKAVLPQGAQTDARRRRRMAIWRDPSKVRR